LKYYINYFEYYSLRLRLKEALKLDHNSIGSDGYNITSLYFDDMDSSAISEKQAGILTRYKWRIRIYNFSDDSIKLEKKIRVGQYISKKSHRITKDEYKKIIDGDYSFLIKSKVSLLIEFYDDLVNNRFLPKVIVGYTREAYVSAAGNVRITFDKNLSTGLNNIDLFDKNIPYIDVVDKGLTILEVKYDNFLPEYIKDLLQIHSSRKEAISKYVICTKYTKHNSWEDQ